MSACRASNFSPRCVAFGPLVLLLAVSPHATNAAFLLRRTFVVNATKTTNTTENASAATQTANPEICGCKKESCTCEGSFNYLKCVSKACQNGCNCTVAPVAHQCDVLADECADNLGFECHSDVTTCEGKFHQASNGTTGLVVDTTKTTENAYCGPAGRCLGELHLAVKAYQPEPDAWMECRVPKFPGAHDLDHGAWLSCGAAVNGTDSSCKTKMVAHLEKTAELKSKCWLTKGKGGKRTTRNAWFIIANHHHKAHTENAHVVGVTASHRGHPDEDDIPVLVVREAHVVSDKLQLVM